MNMKNEMIPLTVANTLDQSQKKRVEVPQNASLKQAIQDMKLAPKGQFDIYDATGSVISNSNAAAHRDSTIYVGVAKVAGGAGIEFDDDWDEGIDLDDIPIKEAHLTLIMQDGARHNINPQPRETVMQVVERAGLKPRDGSPLEVRDNHQEVVSNLIASDMIGRSFFVVPQRIPGGGKYSKRREDHPALVPQAIIDQTTVFTQPRGRLEMGGLLIGHIDHKGNNVVVCGFFPKQTEASPGYCEFDGGALAMAMDACDMANSRCGGPHTPDIQIIGWIHTHPDIGIFLSGIDVNTFGSLRANRPDGRFVAVVVDPLREEHGVFITEKAAQTTDARPAGDKIKLSEDLEARYNKFLTRMRYFQNLKGKEALPFIMPGLLYSHRKALGDEDDILEARFQTIDILSRNSNNLHSKTIPQIQSKFNALQNDFSYTKGEQAAQINLLRSELKKESITLRGLQNNQLNKLIELDATLREKLKKESNTLKALQNNQMKELTEQNISLREELKEESNTRSALEKEMKVMREQFEKFQQTCEDGIEDNRLQIKQKLHCPIKFPIAIHSKASSEAGAIDAPELKAKVDA